jgi:hypothetical protein
VTYKKAAGSTIFLNFVASDEQAQFCDSALGPPERKTALNTPDHML